MMIRSIHPDYAVSPQIQPDDLAEVSRAGFRSVMCNRPDGESPDQPPFQVIADQATALGLKTAHVPVVSGRISEQDVLDFAQAIKDLPKPVFAYCRSGGRCGQLHELAQRMGAL